ncbi:hypothetical protein BGZ47_003919 [Haplosporangium gracile]|nr:hypothetical protein BGZ47_003919 [Haplosporangium gracile]
MRFDTTDVNVVNGLFSPQELNIAPGDTVNWPNNDGADHTIVETNAGARTCNSKAGDSIPVDGIGANCAKGATGTIYVGPRPTGADPNASAITSGGNGGPTSSGAITTPSSTFQPVTTSSLSSSHEDLKI